MCPYRRLLHAADGYAAVNLGHETLQDFARAEFYEFGCSVCNHIAHALGPAHRGGELSYEVGFDSVGSV